MLISVRATAAYDLPDETFLLLMVEPPLVGPAHRVEQAQLLTTPTPFHELGTENGSGNPQRRIIAPKGSFSFEFTATIETAPNDFPGDAVQHPPRGIPAEDGLHAAVATASRTCSPACAG